MKGIKTISLEKYQHTSGKRLQPYSLPAATKLGQGYFFTGVCLSTGGVLPQCMLTYPPREQTPRTRHPLGPDPPGPGRHPPDQADTTPPRTRQTPPPQDQADTPPRPGRHPPQTRQTPPAPGRHPPRTRQDPPRKQTTEYGLRAAGTHPTGMHSC